MNNITVQDKALSDIKDILDYYETNVANSEHTSETVEIVVQMRINRKTGQVEGVYPVTRDGKFMVAKVKTPDGFIPIGVAIDAGKLSREEKKNQPED